jgi:molybdopterin synthase catalytic subunit
MFTLTKTTIETSALVAAAESPSSGALVIFEGRVRNHHHDKEVTALDYSAHPTLTVPEGEKLIAETLAKFPDVERIAASHRIGLLQVGEIAVAIAITSPHRPAAFAACNHLAQQLKHRLPVWKHEHFADGTSSWT